MLSEKFFFKRDRVEGGTKTTQKRAMMPMMMMILYISYAYLHVLSLSLAGGRQAIEKAYIATRNHNVNI